MATGQERRQDFLLHTPEGQDFSAVATEAPLITYKSSECRSVDLANNGMGNHYLRDVDHGSTVLLVTGQHLSQTCPTRHLKVQIYEDTCEVACAAQKDNEFERQPCLPGLLPDTVRAHSVRLLFVCRSPVRNTR